MEDKAFGAMALLLCIGCGIALVRQIRARERELRRFGEVNHRWWDFVVNDLRRLARIRATLRGKRGVDDIRSESMNRRLAASGLETNEARERFRFAHEAAIVGCAIVGLLLFLRYEPLMALCSSIGLIWLGRYGPFLWLYLRRRERERVLEREISFVLTMLRIGSEVGREPVRILDRLTDIVGEEAESHPLAHELRRAQWSAKMGGSWDQGLRSATKLVVNQGIARSLEGLRRALTYEGAKHEMVQQIAIEAHDMYCTALEKRSARLPAQLAMLVLAALFGCSCIFGVRLFLN